ncbi:MAG: gamma-glutamylcyclotransferase family protein [Chloroflexota bacterium]
MTPQYLFVYGTLKNEIVQHKVLGRAVPMEADILMGYAIDWDIFPPYPVATPDDDGTIEGFVLEVMKNDLTHLDHYEGTAYLRVDVTLDSGKQVWVYIGNPMFNTTEE